MGKGLVITLTLVLMLLLVFITCAPKAAPVPAPELAEPAPKTLAKQAWEEDWQRALNEAKKEKRVVIYGSSAKYLQDLLKQGFKEAYGLEIEYIVAPGAAAGAKILSERRGGLHLVDFYIGGSTTPLVTIKSAGALDPLEPALILPELTNAEEIARTWRGGRLGWVDKDRTLLVILGYASAPIAINTDLVRREEIKSYRDLLNPKWKGKIVMDDPTKAGSPQNLFSIMGSKVLGFDYFRQLAEQDLVISTDQRLQVEWVARGKYAMAIASRPEIVREFQSAGAPLGWVIPQEGTYLSAGGGSVALINKAPHPNAAKVFINWLLTKEGQSIFSKGWGVPSRRLDVSTEGLEPINIPEPGQKYIESEVEELLLQKPEHAKLAIEIFGHLLK